MEKPMTQSEHSTVKELGLSLERLRDIPEECEQDVEDAKKDIKRFKKVTIAACIIFGTLAIYELGYMIYGIAAQKTDIIYLTLLVFIMDILFILYNVREYQSRKTLLEMYIANRKVLTAWAKMTIEEINREVTLALRVEELERKKKMETLRPVNSEDWEALAKIVSDYWMQTEYDLPTWVKEKVEPKWAALSARFVDANVCQSEIADAYTELSSLPDMNDPDAIYKEFYDVLYGHTDRMWFNPWIRCQLLLSNLIRLLELDVIYIR